MPDAHLSSHLRISAAPNSVRQSLQSSTVTIGGAEVLTQSGGGCAPKVRAEALDLWIKPLSDGTFAVALINKVSLIFSRLHGVVWCD